MVSGDLPYLLGGSLTFEWVHLAYDENVGFAETYGFAGNQGIVNLEGIRILQKGSKSNTLLIYMHPASTLQLLPVPRAMAEMGVHVLCAGSRYARNDTAGIMEKIALDLGAYIRHAKTVWGYSYVILVGWSGGGALAMFYQSQAERPTITHTPAGDPIDLKHAGLIPADAIIFQAAHRSRAHLLLDALDPSVLDEANPDLRDATLDIYDTHNPVQPPYPAEYIEWYRAAQLGRMRRITSWVKETLSVLRQKGTGEVERGFVTHRTMADPRFVDASLDPNGRKIGWCYMGLPETVNSGPVGLARFSTLRAWLSQWSVDDSRADGLACATRISVPLLAIENCADDAVPQPHVRAVFDAAASQDKVLKCIEGATHYYMGQPELLKDATQLALDWLSNRKLLH